MKRVWDHGVWKMVPLAIWWAKYMEGEKLMDPPPPNYVLQRLQALLFEMLCNWSVVLDGDRNLFFGFFGFYNG